MSANSSTRAGDITKFLIRNSADETKNIDLSAIVQEVSYYEDVFQPSVQVKATILESGMTDKPDIGPFGILNTLPVRGGEPVILKIEDNQCVFPSDIKVSLILSSSGSPWTISGLTQLTLNEAFLSAESEEETYYLTYERIIALKVKKKPKSSKAGFGR